MHPAPRTAPAAGRQADRPVEPLTGRAEPRPGAARAMAPMPDGMVTESMPASTTAITQSSHNHDVCP